MTNSSKLPALITPQELDLTENLNLEMFCEDREMSSFDVVLTIQNIWRESDGCATLFYSGREYDLTNGLWVE